MGGQGQHTRSKFIYFAFSLGHVNSIVLRFVLRKIFRYLTESSLQICQNFDEHCSLACGQLVLEQKLLT